MNLEKMVLSNPWFGVGGLERVYLAVTSISPESWIVASKCFHDADSFKFYFGEHKPFPKVFDMDTMVEGDSPQVYECMNKALDKFFAAHGTSFNAHVTNHWGLFHNGGLDKERTFIYFQPGVWEMEQIGSNSDLLEKYIHALQEHEVLANSAYMKQALLNRFDCESTILYPCTDTEYFQAIRKRESKNSDGIEVKPHDIMIFSRLNPGKQFTQALDIFSAIHDERENTTFLVAGAIRREDMGFLEELERIARDKGLEGTITFAPNPSLDALRDLYSKSKLLLFLPKNEPLGLVPVEATCSGVPVIGFNSGGIKETVVHGKTGMTCKDETEIIETTITLLLEPSRIAKLQSGSRVIEEKFSEKTFLTNLGRIVG